MAHIQVLPESLIRKIAAGEVIERPASVVKELVENSLDAGARRVEVQIREGGRQGIEVVDDGSGMSREDVLLCTERHATSKLRGPTDLFAIASLGFRGEALASIGAVSRLSIETRTADEEEGTRLVVEGGIRRDLSTIGRDVGTSVSVRSIFFNTPARRKFLRHVDTETRHITQAVVQLASAYPQVGFRLVNQEREALHYLPGERGDRAADLLDLDSSELLVAEGEEDGISVFGLLAPPGHCRRSRTRQYLLVRQRPIVSRALNSAVYAGYGGLLGQGAHPIFCLWLDVDPRQVDVNVHPTKREIRLAQERRVREVVQDAVRRALDMPETAHFTANQTGGGDGAVAEAGPMFRPHWGGGALDPTALEGAPTDQMALSLVPAVSPRPAPEDEEGDGISLGNLGSSQLLQIHRKYIVATIRGGIALIDQHAAHERVRYEEVLDALAQEQTASQHLLMPHTLEVSPVEMGIFREAAGMFTQLGFGVREFGATSLIVDSIPPELRNWDDGEVFYRILTELSEELEARSEAREAMAASMACHTSIRTGERLGSQEMEVLIARLLQAREPFVCPHGRPVVVRVELGELDRLFGRT